MGQKICDCLGIRVEVHHGERRGGDRKKKRKDDFDSFDPDNQKLPSRRAKKNRPGIPLKTLEPDPSETYKAPPRRPGGRPGGGKKSEYYIPKSRQRASPWQMKGGGGGGGGGSGGGGGPGGKGKYERQLGHQKASMFYVRKMQKLENVGHVKQNNFPNMMGQPQDGLGLSSFYMKHRGKVHDYDKMMMPRKKLSQPIRKERETKKDLDLRSVVLSIIDYMQQREEEVGSMINIRMDIKRMYNRVSFDIRYMESSGGGVDGTFVKVEKDVHIEINPKYKRTFLCHAVVLQYLILALDGTPADALYFVHLVYMLKGYALPRWESLKSKDVSLCSIQGNKIKYGSCEPLFMKDN